MEKSVWIDHGKFTFFKNPKIDYFLNQAMIFLICDLFLIFIGFDILPIVVISILILILFSFAYVNYEPIEVFRSGIKINGSFLKKDEINEITAFYNIDYPASTYASISNKSYKFNANLRNYSGFLEAIKAIGFIGKKEVIPLVGSTFTYVREKKKVSSA
ncbi:MAG: hypothetical protein AABY04_00180 [Candidatus Micrarchaeota archaeon]